MRVTTEREVYEADKLVVTAGAWNHSLLSFLRGLLTPEAPGAGLAPAHAPRVLRARALPGLQPAGRRGRYYGFPVFGIPGFKFGRYHHLEEAIDPDAIDREPNLRDEQILRDFAERYFPDGAGTTMSLKSCMFTNTPDGHFIIDQHPDHPQVSFASPCSGHGFKFVSVLGEIMADLAEAGRDATTSSCFGWKGSPVVRSACRIWATAVAIQRTASINRVRPRPTIRY